MSNAITQLAKIIKNKLVRTVGGQKPDSNGNINMEVYATKNKNNQFTVAQGFADHIFVDASQSDDGTILSGDVGNGSQGLIHQYSNNTGHVGDGIGLGAGGLTVLGGGEAVTSLFTAIENEDLPDGLTFLANGAINSSTELSVVVADGPIAFGSNYQSGGNHGSWWGIRTNGDLGHYTHDLWIKAVGLSYLDSVTDLNDLNFDADFGVGSKTLPNLPEAAYGWLSVRISPSGELAFQRFQTNTGNLYFRSRNGSTASWDKWKKVATTEI